VGVVDCALADFFEEFLADCGITSPPVDPVKVAEHLGIHVCKEKKGRGRRGRAIGRLKLIYVTDEKNPAREKFSVCHEIVECLYPTLARKLASHFCEMPREELCDAIGAMILVPPCWFPRDYRECGGDLHQLMAIYQASGEVVLKRMVSDDPWTVVSVWDKGVRKQDLQDVRPVLPTEQLAQKRCHATRRTVEVSRNGFTSTAWSLFDRQRGWPRELVRTTHTEDDIPSYDSAFDDGPAIDGDFGEGYSS